MIVFRTIAWYLHLGASVVFSIPLLIKTLKQKKTLSAAEYSDLIADYAQKWALSHIKTSGVRYHVSGLDNLPEKGPVLYVANHQGIFDIGTFLGYLPFPKGFICKVEVLRIPLITYWMREMNCIFMDRQNIKDSARAIATGVEQLRNGHSIVVFPEGHRYWPEGPGVFKAGSFKLAIKAGVPIVPVTIHGTFRALELNHAFIKPTDVQVRVHPPVATAGLTAEEVLLIPERVEKAITTCLAELKQAEKAEQKSL